jgi:hypothetical protein
MTALYVEDNSVATDDNKVVPINKTFPSATINIILMVKEHGAHAIAELDESIAELDERRARLIKERETIQKMLDITLSHETNNG